MLTPADLGRRVVVRRLLGTDQGRSVYGDVIGTLEAWAGGRLAIRRGDGVLVEIDEDTVVAGKPVPPPPARRQRPASPAGRSGRPEPPADPEGPT